MRSLLPLLPSLLLLLTACSSDGAARAAAVEVEGRTWRLASIEGSPPLAGSEVTLVLEGDHASGDAGANRYTGTLVRHGAASGGKLEPSPMAATRMFRDDPPGLMNQEVRYLDLLGRVDAWRVRAEDVPELVLIEHGKPVLVFRPAE
jgi:heat shock protein HslJ